MRLAYLIEPPFNFLDSAGQVTGCDIELARSVLAQIGQGEAELVETEFAQLLPGLAAGRWRMTTGLFATAERRRVASFSRPIWALADGLLVARGNPRAIAGYRSFVESRRLRLAVVSGQVQRETALALGLEVQQLAAFATYAEAAEAVEAGRADGYASVARAHAGFLALQPARALELVAVPAAEKPPAPGCFAFARDDAALRQAVDETLGGLLGSPTHRAMMARFGFGAEEVDLVLSEGGH